MPSVRVPPGELFAVAPAEEGQKATPRLRKARVAGHITDIQLQMLDSNIQQLIDYLGGCERIAYTPLPFTYSVILHRTVYLYCLMLPFGLLDAIGFMTPLMVAFVAYTFFAIEALSDEIEDPFGPSE